MGVEVKFGGSVSGNGGVSGGCAGVWGESEMCMNM